MNILEWFKPKRAEAKDYSTDRSQKQEHEALLQQGTCPKCRSKESMRLGPEGGSSQNCMCIACREEFNLFFMNGVTILDYLGRASESRAKSLYGWEKDTI